jgi:hypothetical protein
MLNWTANPPYAARGSLSLLDRAVFASISAMSVFALFSPLL